MRYTIGTRIIPLLLFCVIGSARDCDAGVMISSMEAESTTVVVWSNCRGEIIRSPLDDGLDHHEFTMTVTSGGVVGSPAPAATDLVDSKADDPQLSQWLGLDARVLIPDAIPICLLKVPIVAL